MIAQEKAEGFLLKRTRSVRSGPGIHLAHNSAKLKIFNLPKLYPVVKVLERTCGSLWRNLAVSLRPSVSVRSPAIRWSVGETLRFHVSHPTDQRSDVGIDRKTAARSRRAAVPTALALELLGALRPDIQFVSGSRRGSGLSSRSRVVETRRLELLTLSLQRRCSAS